VAAVVAIVALAAGAWWLQRGERLPSVAVPVAVAPVAIAAAAPVDAGVIDAAAIAREVPDAATAPGRPSRRRPPAPPPATAPPVTAPPASASAPPRGTATLTIAATPFATIKIDGAVLTTTPVFDHPIPAGRHEVILIDPATGAERLRRTVDLAPGGHQTIRVGP
jgi:hypothetical protein